MLPTKAHAIQGVALYYTREPNYIADISSTWEKKTCRRTLLQGSVHPDGHGAAGLRARPKSQQVAAGQMFLRGELLKVLHPSALHCGI